jgi:hypothetical protein
MRAAVGLRNGLVLVLPFWILVACVSFGFPPVGYQGSVSAAVHFMDQAAVAAICEERGLSLTAACAEIGGSQIWIENPCDWPGDSYAQLLCHEIGHINGWPANHGLEDS